MCVLLVWPEALCIAIFRVASKTLSFLPLCNMNSTTQKNIRPNACYKKVDFFSHFFVCFFQLIVLFQFLCFFVSLRIKICVSLKFYIQYTPYSMKYIYDSENGC